MPTVQKRLARRVSDVTAAVKKVVRKETAGAAKSRMPVSDELFRRIQDRAYELYCRGGYVSGNDKGHWLEAERQILAESGAGKEPGKSKSRRP